MQSGRAGALAPFGKLLQDLTSLKMKILYIRSNLKESKMQFFFLDQHYSCEPIFDKPVNYQLITKFQLTDSAT